MVTQKTPHGTNKILKGTEAEGRLIFGESRSKSNDYTKTGKRSSVLYDKCH